MFKIVLCCVQTNVTLHMYVHVCVRACVFVFQGDCSLAHLGLAANGLTDQSVRSFTR